MFDFSRKDLEFDIRQILKIQLHKTAILYNAEAVDRILFPETDGSQFYGDLDWDENLTHIEENIDLTQTHMAEAILDIYDFATNPSPSEYWIDEGEKEYFLDPVRKALPQSDAKGNIPAALAPESRVNKVLNFAHAAIKVGEVFKNKRSIAPLFLVSELASLANTSEQTVRNQLSKAKTLLEPLKYQNSQTGIAFDAAIEWRSSRRNFTPFPIKMDASSAARDISFEGVQGKSCPVYILGMIWNIGKNSEIAKRLEVSEQSVQKLMSAKNTDDKYLLSKVGLVIGIDDVDEFVKLAIKNNERRL